MSMAPCPLCGEDGFFTNNSLPEYDCMTEGCRVVTFRSPR